MNTYHQHLADISFAEVKESAQLYGTLLACLGAAIDSIPQDDPMRAIILRMVLAARESR